MDEPESRRTRRPLPFVTSSRAQSRLLSQRVSTILAIPESERSSDDASLLHAFPEIVKSLEAKKRKTKEQEERLEEKLDSQEEIDRVSDLYVKALKKSKYAVVYTGAGVSTAANIPDYRGPEGIWTKLKDGRGFGIHDLEGATPTMCHMALKQLVDLGLIRHIVSQNCDGLHLRSGVPRRKMSEVHGNMYIEACLKCRPPVEYVRDFDVTEKTGRFNHKTGRKCYYCGNDLKDTIVHFGERGKIMWPLNWRGIDAIMDDVDLILCLGSSLKVLKSYERLWARERSAKQKPDLFIVNLQWTPKDKCCSVKLHARCDDFMKLVMEKLQVNIPPYPSQWGDPLRRTATPLHPWEKVTSVKANNWYEKQIEVEVKKSSLKTENDVSSSAEDSTSASWTPSGYFKHVALFRSVPEGVNPYEGVEFPAKTSVTKEQQPSSIPSLPQPGWYGRYLKKIPTTKRSRRRGKGLRCAVGSTAKPEETSQIIQLKIESVSELLPDSDDCVEKIENPLILSQDQDAVIFVDT